MFRMAIAGCGLITRKKHLPALMRLKKYLEVAALCDLNEEAAGELGGAFGIKNVYTDYSKMLNEIKPDIVDIATPPSTHAKLAVSAMQNNAHVLLEKPMALSLQDCDAIADAAQRYGRRVCVIHNQLFNPVFLKARDIVSKGKVGKFLGMRIFLSTPADYMTARAEHWAHKLPGGVLGETGPHIAYLTLAFLKNIKDVSIRARKQTPEFNWSKAEDFRIELIADNGISSVCLIYGTNQWAADIEIIAERGILRLDLESHVLTRYDRRQLNPFSVGGSVLGSIWQASAGMVSYALQYLLGRKKDPHLSLISSFIESIAKNKPSPVSIDEAREAVKVTDMLVKKLEGAL